MKIMRPFVRLFACAGAAASLAAQTVPTPATATNQTPGIRAPGAELAKLSGDLQFAEGPACDPAGNVFFTGQPNNRIMRFRSASASKGRIRRSSGPYGWKARKNPILLANAPGLTTWTVPPMVRLVTGIHSAGANMLSAVRST